jgi:type I restriction enzyme R subunit
MKFTEDKLERAFAELLAQEGYPHSLGNTILRQPDDVLIEDDLHHFLKQRYANQEISDTDIKSIILELNTLPASDLYGSNKRFMRMLSLSAGCLIWKFLIKKRAIVGSIKE